MSLNLNKVVLAGRIVAEPEYKQTQSGVSVTTFRIAVNRRYTSGGDAAPQADFFNVVAWRNTGDFVAKYFHKGSAICVCGQINNRTWTDQTGNKRTVTEIIADEASFVESLAAADQAAAPAPATQPAAPSAPQFKEIADDDDLPF